MVDLDLKDRKILYELDLNCRQSNAQIGKKVGLSRKVVEYRIKRMEDDGAITGYSTLIDIFKLGYHVYRLYLKLQDIPPDIKNELVSLFINYKNVWVVHSTTGKFDIGSVIFVDNVYEFYNFYNNIVDNYGNYISEKTTGIYVIADEYEKTYLLSEVKDNHKRLHYPIICDGSICEIDELDYKILNKIVVNARIPLIKLADELKTSHQTINNRIKCLLSNGVIKNFRVDIDFSKIGLKYFYIQFILKDTSKRNDIINFVKLLPSFKCLNVAIGYTEMDLEFIFNTIEEMDDLLDKLENKFPNSIRSFYYFKNRQTHKERWLPEMEFK